MALAWLGLSAHLSAEPGAEARTALEQTWADVTAALFPTGGPSDPAQRESALLEALGGRFSFMAMVRGAMGAHWKALDATQQAELLPLMERLLVRTYASGFKKGPAPVLVIQSVEAESAVKVRIESQVRLTDATLAVSYRLAKLGGNWQVFDVTVDGVSLTQQYREQFNAHFDGGGDGAALLERLRRQLEAKERL